MLEGDSYSKEQMEGVFSSLYNTISCINMMLRDNELTYKPKQKYYPFCVPYGWFFKLVRLPHLVYLVMESMAITPWIKEASTMMTIFVIRMMAVRYDWHFPDISLMKKRSLW